MSDSRRVYRAIKQAMKQLSPTEPKGHHARHLATLAFMVSGLVLGKSCQLPALASHNTTPVHPDSREKQMRRWLQNNAITWDTYYLPFVQPLLTALAAQGPLVLIMDGSAVARGCVTLMLSVVYGHRTLPVAWVVVAGRKGHFPTDTHVALLRAVHAVVPPTAQVVLLGDGEFDSPELQAEATDYGWAYVCRTAKNIQIGVGDTWVALEDLPVVPGQWLALPHVQFTRAAYGPVLALVWWEKGYEAPLYLVSNLTSAVTAYRWYRQRMFIETFFSDQKSRGFQLAKSHLHDPARVQRLLIATCWAYLWLVYLGTLAQRPRWQAKIHRRHRCDLSLFQLGLRLLAYLLNQNLPIPSVLTLQAESVR